MDRARDSRFQNRQVMYLTIEIVAAVLTLWSVYLSAKKHRLSWPVGIAALGFYSIIFFHVKLYADLSLQVFFLIQGIMGMVEWYRNRESNNTFICKIERLSFIEMISYLMCWIILYGTAAYVFSTFTNASNPYIDSLVASMSLMANYLLVKRKFENWFIWIAVDAIYVGLFIYKGLNVSAVLYAILFFLAIKGLIDWKNHLKLNVS